MLLYNIYPLGMKFSRATRFGNLGFGYVGLIGLMPLAQLAIAQHSAAHELHESSTYCQAYNNAEATKLLVFPDSTWSVDCLPQAAIEALAFQQIETKLAQASARSPPQST